MRQCPNCGKHCQTDEERCPHCDYDITRASRVESRKRANIKVRKIVPWGIAFFIIVLLIILFILLRNFNSPEAQSNLLINAMENDDTQKLSTILSTKDNKVDGYQAETYIKYVKNEIGMKRFKEAVNQKIDQLNHDSNGVRDTVKSRNGDNLLQITKNGRRYLFFDNMNFTAPSKEAIVKPKMDATYKFKSNDKQKTVEADKDKATSLGKFIPGNYSIDAKRETNTGQFTGELKFNFKDSNSETVNVNEDFNEAYIEPKIEGAKDLDHNSIRIHINDHTYDYKKGQAYGPYPKTKEVTVSAEGAVKKKTFKSTSTQVKTDNMRDLTNVTLKFDEDDINKYVEKKEKEESSFKDKLTNFFFNYANALNSATLQNDFGLVSNYLKKDTTNYKSTRNEVNRKSYTHSATPQVLDVIKQGKTFYVTTNQYKSDGSYGKVDYELEGNNEGEDLKIVSSSD
ncbi:hypothetical protein N9R04_00765 [Staphylococcus sp. SQ8-PEA]|uniref:Membrane-associated protein n=1 Tax=Staphylococcus marylandisciuri TaxID=2981529 RepID=A0ABT2QMQ1_9STAP|nr:hypothetical protein [Staphylococcus marylandisciuri]MCU5745251.1 hypothetical protein [Staphylococcus marylandisciuri]